MYNEDWECFYCQMSNNWPKPECYWCKKVRKEEEKTQIPLYVPSADYGEYEMKTVDEEYGYIFYFKEGEPKTLGKEAHVHIRGNGRHIQYFLSPLRLKKKTPKNFPEREESKLYKIVRERWQQYLFEWEKAKNE